MRSVSLIISIALAMTATAAVGPSPGSQPGQLSIKEAQDKYPGSEIACCKNKEDINADGILGNLLQKGLALQNLLGTQDSACAKTSLIENLNILGFTKEGADGVSCSGTTAYCPEDGDCKPVEA
ncbi:hypothetical protein BGW36DRAFT_389875 [Talaromyces proteolyticus]|uniref:Hydrophobin n=1 Tax=Talaromyces proteolyticus TaxID=1131652 RepID=A0AAD4PU88_9EURO|nr:uncharacterized protein BGW36DRAFT_389875 [Talaromyces proteolyticus]KAH8689877.1 hypothetical protein BGW36DRAFT_389875 [Talaromyces proteolyticus]